MNAALLLPARNGFPNPPGIDTKPTSSGPAIIISSPTTQHSFAANGNNHNNNSNTRTTHNEMESSQTTSRLNKATGITLELCRTFTSIIHNDRQQQQQQVMSSIPASAIIALNDACDHLQANIGSTNSSQQRTALQATRHTLSALLTFLPHLSATNVSDTTVRSAIFNLQLAIIEVKLAYEELLNYPSPPITPPSPQETKSTADFPTETTATTATAATIVASVPTKPASISENVLVSTALPSSSSPTRSIKSAKYSITSHNASTTPQPKQNPPFLHSGRIAIITASALLEKIYTCLRRHPSFAAFIKKEQDSLKPSSNYNSSSSSIIAVNIPKQQQQQQQQQQYHRRANSERVQSHNAFQKPDAVSNAFARKDEPLGRLHQYTSNDLAHIRNRSDSQVVLQHSATAPSSPPLLASQYHNKHNVSGINIHLSATPCRIYL